MNALINNAIRLLLAITIGVLSGCATKKLSDSSPLPGHGIQEYRQIASESLTNINTALEWLNRVSAQTNYCAPELVQAFDAEVQALQIESMRVRERAQAIQARGDAYFDNWSENLARIADPRVRELAEHYRPQLRESFLKIKLESQKTREVFSAFSAGLRKLRTALEADPGVIRTDATKELIRKTSDDGQQVLQHLGAVKAELQTMTEMLTPKSAANP